jgi:chromatin segregation and condensation protein Rec8/ScpA/Scc1 (kleisin family)
MTTKYAFECSNTISEPEAELAFNLGLQLITEYRSITPSLALEREALDNERTELEHKSTLERESLDKINAELKRFYEGQLKSLEQRYETRLQQTHDQHNRALDAIKRQETNYVQEKLGEIAGLLKQNKTIVDKGCN